MISLPDRVEVMIEKEIDARGRFSHGPLMELLGIVRGMPEHTSVQTLVSKEGRQNSSVPPLLPMERKEQL